MKSFCLVCFASSPSPPRRLPFLLSCCYFLRLPVLAHTHAEAHSTCLNVFRRPVFTRPDFPGGNWCLACLHLVRVSLAAEGERCFLPASERRRRALEGEAHADPPGRAKEEAQELRGGRLSVHACVILRLRRGGSFPLFLRGSRGLPR